MGSAFSVVASVAILRSTVNDIVPEELRTYFWSFTRRFSTEITISIKESHEGSSNRLFYAVVAYLDGHALSNSALPQRLTVGKSEKIRNLMFGLERNSEIVDKFQDVPMKWKYNTDFNSTSQLETRWYELRFHKMQAEMVKNNYLPHILDMAKFLKDQNKIVKFHTVRHDRWSSNRMNLDHPMTFKTLVMDGDLKEKVVKDLDRFRNAKEYYKTIGKVWKRGYLLYGPPGTGKSSLIAAMANYMNYDVYNMNLSAVNSDSTLENLLLHVPSRSILVVEDIDCSIKLTNREAEKSESDSYRGPQVTLAGLLNAIDGLLSCCGEEKITVFTTNYKERIDPALLRPGRMDVHINLSYCTLSTFKQLAANYLEIFNDELFPIIEKLTAKVKVSPADVAGVLMTTENSKTSLEDLVKFLENKESEDRSSVAAEQENHNNSNQKIQRQGEAFITNEIGESTNDLMKNEALISKYTIKEELVAILKAMFSKHGDIAANTTLHSMQCTSSFLEILCGIIQKLHATKLQDLTEVEVKAMISEVEDLESVKIEVGWLHKRLDEISNAMRLIELKAVSEKLSDTIFGAQVKLTCCETKSLVDGLL
ncbi:AAA-ATPase At3g50940-like [Pistacia vera]|uniref:AAA-ATPase At3g50940-like n=1 Tax=Pistacia vera TaxID=55513 RepID=UPI0012636F50|nr:AAA-ATPase At3g50940-like [Pistacia vera]